jgi:hypothetical protein
MVVLFELLLVNLLEHKILVQVAGLDFWTIVVLHMFPEEGVEMGFAVFARAGSRC